MGNCLFCRNFVGSSSITVVGTSLVVNIPASVYNNGAKLCLGIAQDLPDEATINMPVVVTIGTDTTQYPLVKCNGNAVVASDVSVRDMYKVKVQINSASTVFRVLNVMHCCNNYISSIPASTPTTGGTT